MFVRISPHTINIYALLLGFRIALVCWIASQTVKKPKPKVKPAARLATMRSEVVAPDMTTARSRFKDSSGSECSPERIGQQVMTVNDSSKTYGQLDYIYAPWCMRLPPEPAHISLWFRDSDRGDWTTYTAVVPVTSKNEAKWCRPSHGIWNPWEHSRWSRHQRRSADPGTEFIGGWSARYGNQRLGQRLSAQSEKKQMTQNW